MIREWVVGKLWRQMRLTKRIVRKQTDGELDWPDHIEIEENVDETGVRPVLPDESVLELRRELSERRRVGSKAVFAALKSRIVEGAGYCALCVIGEDDLARSSLVKWLLAQPSLPI